MLSVRWKSPRPGQVDDKIGPTVFVQYMLMFAQPQKFLHKPHRWVWGLMGKLPK